MEVEANVEGKYGGGFPPLGGFFLKTHDASLVSEKFISFNFFYNEHKKARVNMTLQMLSFHIFFFISCYYENGNLYKKLNV